MNNFVQTAWKIGTDSIQMQQGAMEGWVSLFNGWMEQQSQLVAYQFEAASKMLDDMIGEGTDHQFVETAPAAGHRRGISNSYTPWKAEETSLPPELLNPNKETVNQWLEILREEQPTDCG